MDREEKKSRFQNGQKKSKNYFLDFQCVAKVVFFFFRVFFLLNLFYFAREKIVLCVRFAGMYVVGVLLLCCACLC